MNILQLLEKSGEKIYIKYFGPDDFATAYDLKTLITNEKEIIEYFQQKKLTEIKNTDDFIDYLVLRKITNMKEIIPNIISQEVIQQFDKMLTKIMPMYESVRKRSIIKYINSNIKVLFELREIDVWFADVLMELLDYFKSGVTEETWYYLAVNEGYLLYDNYDTFQMQIEKYDKVIEAIFSKDTVLKHVDSRLDEITKIIEAIYTRGRRDLVEKTDAAIKCIIEYAEEKGTNQNAKNVINNMPAI